MLVSRTNGTGNTRPMDGSPKSAIVISRWFSGARSEGPAEVLDQNQVSSRGTHVKESDVKESDRHGLFTSLTSVRGHTDLHIFASYFIRSFV